MHLSLPCSFLQSNDQVPSITQEAKVLQKQYFKDDTQGRVIPSLGKMRVRWKKNSTNNQQFSFATSSKVLFLVVMQVMKERGDKTLPKIQQTQVGPSSYLLRDPRQVPSPRPQSCPLWNGHYLPRESSGGLRHKVMCQVLCLKPRML